MTQDMLPSCCVCQMCRSNRPGNWGYPTLGDFGASMFLWVIDKQLARGRRPGCSGERGLHASCREVDASVEVARSFGVKSIICLLADDQLVLYLELSSELVGYYWQADFSVAHVPTEDHQWPPPTETHLERILEAYHSLSKPVLVHFSEGIDRTGLAVEYISKRVDHIALHAAAGKRAARIGCIALKVALASLAAEWQNRVTTFRLVSCTNIAEQTANDDSTAGGS